MRIRLLPSYVVLLFGATAAATLAGEIPSITSEWGIMG